MLDSAVKEITVKAVSELLGVDNKPGTEILAASLREMLLRVDMVCAITGLSTPTVYRLMSQGRFPRPVKLTGYARAWRLSDIMTWIDTREPDRAGIAAESSGASTSGGESK